MLPGVEGTIMNEPVDELAKTKHLLGEAQKLLAAQNEQLKIAKQRIEELEAENLALKEELNKPLT